MAFNDLIRSFGRMRDYMREFYVYGFKTRGEYTRKSARSYDDIRRRLESWLGGCMGAMWTAEGKTVFLSVDSRVTRRNPFFKAFAAKTFTDGDITLHFLLFDILYDPAVCLSLGEITEKLDEMLSSFRAPRFFDESTVRKKLAEYAEEGLVEIEKRGRSSFYRRVPGIPPADENLVHMASETMPLGVIGSYLLEDAGADPDCLAFKHHYITSAPDSEVLLSLLTAMQEGKGVALRTVSHKSADETGHAAVPLRIFVSVQSGRQYLLAYVPETNRITAFRLDYIVSVREGKKCEKFSELRKTLSRMQKHMWGVSTGSVGGERLSHVEFTVRYDETEGHIHRRLLREKRIGTVEQLDEHHSRFSAEVYDASELLPWMRTFLCRITEVHISDKRIERRFLNDIKEMYALYGLEEGNAS